MYDNILNLHMNIAKGRMFVTMLQSVMWVCLCIQGHIHCSCSTVMALLCIPLSELVSFAFSTIPMSLFRIFSSMHIVVVTVCSNTFHLSNLILQALLGGAAS